MADSGSRTIASRKHRQGEVVSKVGDKTVTVMVERRTRHPLYGKILKKRKKYHVHDDDNKAKIGDKVKIVETRPLSRLKHWRIEGIVDQF